MNTKTLMKALLVLLIGLVATIGLLILLPGEKVSDDDLSHLNGFYKVDYFDGYNTAYRDSEGCDNTYKGVLLTNGDKIIKARLLNNVYCEWCGKNEFPPNPKPSSQVNLEVEGNKENYNADLLFEGTGVEVIDLKIVQ